MSNLKALPTLSLPTYNVDIPGFPEKVKFRAFTVKEQKLIMMASETKDPKHISQTILDLIEVCVISPKGINLRSWPVGMIEILLLRIKEVSAGADVTVISDCPSCKNRNPVNIDTSAEVTLSGEVSLNQKPTEIPVDPKRGMVAVLKPNTFAGMAATSTASDKQEDQLYALMSLIDIVKDKDASWTLSEYSEADRKAFYDTMPGSVAQKIIEYVSTQPSVVCQKEVKCSKCGKEYKLDLRGINNFFV